MCDERFQIKMASVRIRENKRNESIERNPNTRTRKRNKKVIWEESFTSSRKYKMADQTR